MFSTFVFSQMPNISNIWMNEGQPYIGTIGDQKKEIKIVITASKQDKNKDQEYFIAGNALVENSEAKFEGKLIVKKYKDSRKKGSIYGEYEFLEERKGKHSGTFKGKFVYHFKWNPKTEKVDEQFIEFIGNWKNYDGAIEYKTEWKN